MRYFLHLAYNGSAFFGWQIQPNHPSVQETLETCLSLLLHEERVAVTGCGRTDTGVNASSFYAHFDRPTRPFRRREPHLPVPYLYPQRSLQAPVRLPLPPCHQRGENERGSGVTASERGLYQLLESTYTSQQLHLPRYRSTLGPCG